MELDLTWEKPELDARDGSMIEHLINCTSSFGYSTAVVTILQKYQLDNLIPFSSYTCCVRSLTTNGISSSSCDTEKTLQDGKLLSQ